VRWDRLFEDLEDQLAADAEAERVALDAESERLRVARLTLRERLRAMIGGAAAFVAVEVAEDTTVRGEICAVGADFIALRVDGSRVFALIPVPAVRSVTMPVEAMRAGDGAPAPTPVAERLTLGFVLRDVSRRRLGVSIDTAAGTVVTGTIDRVGADHLDIALHDAGIPRRRSEVRGVRLLPFASVACVRWSGMHTPSML